MKYYIIAGEASGDLHGSNLMRGIYARDPEANVRFWGGDLMNEVYLKNRKSEDGGLVRHYKGGAIMGFWEVFTHAGKLLGNVRDCKADILSWASDVVILIDYPGFNFKIAEFAHKHGIRTFYYIAPKVWASREGRIRKLKKYVDKLFIVFPFEIPYFERKGVEAEYHGNPLVDAIENSEAMNGSREGFLKRNNLPDKPIIAMLAGSRKGEINTMMPVLTEFARKMKALPKYRDYQFLIAGAPSRSIEDYSPHMSPEDKDVRVLFGETQSIIRNSEAAVVNSGTASLETVLLGTPQAVGYIGAKITYIIAKHIVKIKYISLGNLIIDRLAFKEFIQDECNADNLLAEIRKILEEREYKEKMMADYSAIRNALGGSGASEAVAEAMIKDLRSHRPD